MFENSICGILFDMKYIKVQAELAIVPYILKLNLIVWQWVDI